MQLPPQSEINAALLSAVGLPFLAAAGTHLLLWHGLLTVPLAGKRAGGVGSAVALAAGFAAGNGMRGALDWLPDRYAHDWLLWVGLAALLAGAVAGEGSRPRVAPWLVAVCFSMLWKLVPPEVLNESWWSVPVLAVVVAGNWALADEQARRQPGAIVPVWLALVFLAAAIVLIHAHAQRFMDLALILAASLLGVAASCNWGSGETGPVAGGASVLLAGLMLSGQTQTYSNVPWICFGLVALAPLTLGATLIPAVSRLRPGLRLSLQTLLLLVPLVVAVVLAMQHEKLDFSI